MIRKIEQIKKSYIEKIEKRKANVEKAFDFWTEFRGKMGNEGQFKKNGPKRKNAEICVREIKYNSVEIEPNTFKMDSKMKREDLELFLFNHQIQFLSKITETNLKTEIEAFSSENSRANFAEYVKF